MVGQLPIDRAASNDRLAISFSMKGSFFCGLLSALGSSLFFNSAPLRAAAPIPIDGPCIGPDVLTACNDAQLREAISRGGLVRFCCQGTIVLTNTIEVTRDVALDAQEFAVSISGNNSVRLFKVLPNVQFTATNLLLINGRYVGTNGTDYSTPAQPGEEGMGGAILNEGGHGAAGLVCPLSQLVREGEPGQLELRLIPSQAWAAEAR